MQAFSGEGSFSLFNAKLHQSDPAAFLTLVSTPQIAELDVDALTALVDIALGQGDFAAEQISGLFQIAGGKIRIDNVGASNGDARILGDIRLDLQDLGLNGSWVLTPVNLNNPDGVIDESSARIIANIGGTFGAPTRELDLNGMADAIELRALEIELDELEVLRAEQAARSREIALNRAKLMEETARRAAEEEARQAAEAERVRQQNAAAEAAAEREAEQAPMVFDFESQDPLVQPELQQEFLFSTDPAELLAQ